MSAKYVYGSRGNPKAEFVADKIDMMSSHVVAVLMALYQHLIFSRLLGEYKENDKSTPSITNPILYS